MDGRPGLPIDGGSSEDRPPLRQRAEMQLASRPARVLAEQQAMSQAAMQGLMHELQVHQIELEMQIEELRRTQTELDISQARYLSLYDFAPVGYCSVGGTGRISQSNLTTARMLGANRAVLQGQLFTNFIVPGDQDLFYLFRQRLRINAEPSSCELRLVRADGTTFWVHLVALAMADEDGSSALRLTLSDITEHKLAESKLQVADSVFGHAREVIVITDTDAHIEYVNRAFCKVSGYSVEEVLGKNPRVLQSGLTPQNNYIEMWAALLAGHSWQGEFINKRKTGDLYVESVSISPVRQNDGHISHYLAIKEDITEQKRASQEVLNSQMLLQAVIDSSPDWIYVKDAEHRFKLVNAPFAKAFNLMPDAMIGRPDTDFLAIELCRGIAQQGVLGLHDCDDAVFRGESIHLPQEHIHIGSDMPRVFETFKAPLRDGGKEIFGALCYRRDITERWQNEQQQLILLQQLHQSQKMELIGHLSGGIAHDFNNILASILGYTEIIQMTCNVNQNSQTYRYLQEILQAGIRAKELVQQLLTFSQKRETATATIEVQPIVHEVVKLLKATLPTSIKIVVKIDNDLPRVKISAINLHQILMNLVVNARDAFSDIGKIEMIVQDISLDAGHHCDSCKLIFSGHYVMIVVRDTGTGIPPEAQSKVFDPFFTTKSVGRGSGLGLSVVHGIVHGADGHIELLSAFDVGTELRIYLPAQLSTVNIAAQPMRASSSNAQLNAHVLVVDDDVAIVGVFTVLLESLGCKVTGFSNSPEAMHWFRDNPHGPDLVITDMTMPDMTGADLAQTMLSIRPEMPIILCTGYSATIDEMTALKMGIRSLLVKPISSALFLDTVTQCLTSLLVAK